MPLNKNESYAIHYRTQRDLLYDYLVNTIGVKKVVIAKILGISKGAVSTQFDRPKKNTDERR